jgi:DNA-binding CsgD family transcriptional regulator
VPVAPLVGRQGELAALLRLLDRARTGQGSLAVVTGESGVGKSRLLVALQDEARARGVVTLAGAAVADGPAYRPVAQALLPVLRSRRDEDLPALRPYRAALGRLLPDWAEDQAPERVDVDPALLLGEGVVRLLDLGDDTHHLVVVEDVHWADPDTVALLEYLGPALHGTHTLVVVSAREDRPGGDVVGRLGAVPGATVLPLAPLASDDVRRLIVTRTSTALADDLVDWVVARADGLPLLVEELTESLSGADSPPVDATGPMPSRFAADVLRRVDALSTGARDVVRAASVLGTEPTWSQLPVLTGRGADDVWAGLREAVGAHLLVQDGDLRWRHALTQETIHASLLEPERVALARRAADLLLADARPEDDERAARLFLASGDDDQARRIAVRAAVRERRRSAYGVAQRLLDLADAAGGSPAATAERVLLLTLTGRPAAALELGAPAVDGAVGDEHAELCLRLARAAIDERRWREAEQYVVRAGRPEDPRSPTIAADAAHGSGRVVEAAELADRAVHLAESSGSPEQLCAALVTQGRIARLTSLATSSASFTRAAQVAAEHGLPAMRVEALLGLGTLELLGVHGSGSMRSARDLALDVGLLSTALSAELLLCDHVIQHDGPAEARDRVARLVEQATTLRLHGLQLMGGTMLALACGATGDVPGMERALAAVDAGPGAGPDTSAMADGARAHAALHAYDLPSADALLDRSIPRLLEHAGSAPLHVFGLWALLRTVTGSAGDGGRDARERLRAAPAVERASNLAALRYADAVAAGRAGDGAEAATVFAEADGLLPASSWWRRMLRLPTLERAVADGWGDPVPELRAVLAAHESNGEDRLAAVCRDLLRRAGAPTRRGRGTGPVPPRLRAAGVTSRELDVLRLVRDGRSNAEIAQRLFLSTRTVETHVAHLLAKSGTPDRTRLSVWSREQEDS